MAESEEDSRKGAKGAKFRKISKFLSLRAWRPFDVAQDMLGGKKFLEVGLSNISSGRT